MSGLSANDSAIRVDAALEEKLKGASFEEIKAYMAEQAVSQGLVTRDIYDPQVLLPADPGTQPQSLVRTVTINGTTYTLQGATEHDLNVAETQLYRGAVNQPAAAAATEQPRDAATGQFTRQPSVTAEEKAALDLQFQLGQISSSDYLERSGAVADYLANRGIPIDELQAQVAEKQEARQTQNGEAVVQEFLNGPAGSSWPGGSENLATAARLLQENDLELSVANLAAVFEHMKTYDLVAENPELVSHARIANATSVEQIREAMNRPTSSMFGR